MTSLEGWGSTIELHPQAVSGPGHERTPGRELKPRMAARRATIGRRVRAPGSMSRRPAAPSTVARVADEAPLFERVGGAPYFVELVDRFYDGVSGDPVLRALYPDDLVEPRRHLAMFLAQYWGGPPDYNDERGHPRLRMRHAPFVIGILERDAWLRHMGAAVRESGASAGDQGELLAYFEMAANQLMNAR